MPEVQSPCRRALAEIEKASSLLKPFNAGLWGQAPLCELGELTAAGRHTAEAILPVLAQSAVTCHELWKTTDWESEQSPIIEEAHLLLHVLAAGVRGATVGVAPVVDGEAMHALHRLAERHEEGLRLRFQHLADK